MGTCMDGVYTGTIKGIQDHVVDFSLIPIRLENFCPNHPIPVNMGPVNLISTIHITSFPLTPARKKPVTLLEWFKVLGWDVVVIRSIFLWIFFCILRKRVKDRMWVFLQIFLGQEALNPNQWNPRFVITLYVLSVFWAHQYFFGFMATDLEITDPPQVVDTFDDVMRHNLSPLILKGVNTENIIKGSGKLGAPEVYEKIMSAQSKYMIQMTEANFMHIQEQVAKRKAVVILEEGFAKGIQVINCFNIRDSASDYRKSKDPIATTFRSIAMSYNISQELKERIEEMHYRLFESGLAQRNYESAALDADVLDLDPGLRPCLILNQEKKRENIEDVAPFSMQFMADIFVAWIIGMVSSVPVLLMESLMKRRENRRRELKQRIMKRISRPKAARGPRRQDLHQS